MPAFEPQDVERRLLDFVNSELGLALGRPITAQDFLDAVGVDSLAFLKVLLFVESVFGFWMPDEDLVDENIASVEALTRYVCKRGACA